MCDYKSRIYISTFTYRGFNVIKIWLLIDFFVLWNWIATLELSAL